MIDFTEIVIYLLGLIGAGVGAVVMYWLKRLGDKFGIDIDEKMDARIDAGIERGLGYAVERLRQSNRLPTMQTENEFIEDAVSYVIDKSPKALMRFGLTEASVRQMVESRLSGNYHNIVNKVKEAQEADKKEQAE